MQSAESWAAGVWAVGGADVVRVSSPVVQGGMDDGHNIADMKCHTCEEES